MKTYYLLTCEQHVTIICNSQESCSTIAVKPWKCFVAKKPHQVFHQQRWWGDNIWIFLRAKCYHKNIRILPLKLLFISWNVTIAVTDYITHIQYLSAFCLKRWWFQQMPCKNKCHHVQRQCPGWFYQLLLHREWKYQRPMVLFIFVFKLWIAVNKFHISL